MLVVGGLAYLGQSICVLLLCCCCCVLLCVAVVVWLVLVLVCCVLCVVALHCAGSPSARQPKFSLFFPLSRPHFRYFFFSLSLWAVFSLNFGGEKEGRLGSCVVVRELAQKPGILKDAVVQPDKPPISARRRRPPSALGPPGFHTTSRELQTCTCEGPGASNTTKIPREDPIERDKKTEHCGERGKKNAKCWVPHPSGPTKHDTHQIQLDWPGQNGIGKSWPLPLLCCCVLLCVVGVGVLVWTLRTGTAVVSHDSHSQTCTVQGPGASHHQHSTKRPPRERQKERKRERKQSAKFWAPSPSGSHFFCIRAPLWGPTFRSHMTHTRSKIGLAKTGLAKVGLQPTKQKQGDCRFVILNPSSSPNVSLTGLRLTFPNVTLRGLPTLPHFFQRREPPQTDIFWLLPSPKVVIDIREGQLSETFREGGREGGPQTDIFWEREGFKITDQPKPKTLAEGRRRLLTNTACAHLWGFCWAFQPNIAGGRPTTFGQAG